MTKYGPVQGDLLDGSYRRWQGVPFASPPLGELRWKNPVPPGSWDSPLDCRNFTIACAQLGIILLLVSFHLTPCSPRVRCSV